MTFTVYRNDTCTGTPAFGPSDVTVTGATTLSPVFTPTQTGTYRVIASYSGDANYNSAGPTACLDPAEDVVVTPGAVTLATDVDPDSIVLGATFRDSATLSGMPAGGPAPTGTMTFTVYTNNTCTGTPAFGPSVVTVTGATTLSPVYTPTSTGTYRVVASYSGDANYNAVGPTACWIRPRTYWSRPRCRRSPRRRRVTPSSGRDADGLRDGERARQPAARCDGRVPPLRAG